MSPTLRNVWLLASLASLASLRTAAQSAQHAHVQLLGINDFHGQLSVGRSMLGRPVGSAAVLASYLRDESARFAGGTLIIHAGDFVGGSPVASSLLQDEPALAFLNMLGNEHCRRGHAAELRCNVVGTLGNHEFDEGVAELLRLLRGGDYAGGPFLEQPYRGSRAAYVSANALDAHGKPLLPPYVIRQVEGVRIAIIGAVLTATERMVLPEGLRGARFEDEAEAINRAVRAVQRRGIEAVVVSIHQGAGMIPYDGPTRRDVRLPEGSDIAEIMGKLDPAVDVVVSGHAHQFTNTFVAKPDGREILVTQAHSAGMAYADIELTIDRRTGDVVEKSARILPTFADEGPGLRPAADVAELTARAEARAREIMQRVIGSASTAITQVPNQAGESALGNLIADAQRLAAGADVAFINQGAIRDDLAAGPIRWGALLAIHPFGNVIVSVSMSGAQLRSALEEQWEHDPPHILQVSGLSYRWDANLPVGKRITALRVGGEDIADGAHYRVAMSDYLARGGGGFTRLAAGTERKIGVRDTEALRAFIAGRGGEITARIAGRIVRRD